MALVTSRLARYQRITLDYLAKHCPMDAEINMRAEGDWQPAPDYKLAKLELIRVQYKPLQVVCIDSRIDVCDAYRDKGYFTMEITL